MMMVALPMRSRCRIASACTIMPPMDAPATSAAAIP